MLPQTEQRPVPGSDGSTWCTRVSRQCGQYTSTLLDTAGSSSCVSNGLRPGQRHGPKGFTSNWTWPHTEHLQDPGSSGVMVWTRTSEQTSQYASKERSPAMAKDMDAPDVRVAGWSRARLNEVQKIAWSGRGWAVS